MIDPHRASPSEQAAVCRLSHLAALDPAGRAALEIAMRSPSSIRARRDIVRAGRDLGAPRIVMSGWAARVRVLPEGRRLFLSFLLPGDLIGWCRQSQSLAVSTVTALTDITVCAAPSAEAGSPLAEAYAVSGALEEAHLLGQIMRLGGMNAQERIGDLLLELHERLGVAGLVSDGGFDMPLTQEGLADAVGMTSVHVNRTVQVMRREGDLEWRGKRVTLLDPAALARKVGRARPSVSRGMREGRQPQRG